jgi:hypothetical protein
MAMTYPKGSAGDAVTALPEAATRGLVTAMTPSGGSRNAASHAGNKRYPKGTALSLDAGRLNPRNVAATDKYVGGI